MTDVFACLPQCELADLGLIEWLLIILSIGLVYGLTTFAIEIVFGRSQHDPNSLCWHFPRFLFIALVVAFLTVSPLALLFGFNIASIYAKTALPFICIITYFVWLVSYKEPDT